MADYQVRLLNQQNVTLTQSVPFSRLEWARTEKQVGWMNLNIPGGKIDPSWLAPDARLEIWRTIGARPAYLVGGTQWLLRKKKISGLYQNIVIEAADANYVLDGLMVDYPASTETVTNAKSQKTGAADDVIKAFLRENGGPSSTDMARINASITVAVDLSLGVAIAKQCAHRNLLTVFQEIAADSASQGHYLTWDWAFDGSTLTFNTYIGRRGNDHSSTSASPVTVSAERGNLLDPVVVYDYTDERTVIKAAGNGEGASRAIGTATNAARLAASPFGRREEFIFGYNTSDVNSLAAEASQELFAKRARRVFTGQFADTPASTYGVHIGFGDVVTAYYGGASYDCHLTSEHGTVDDKGEKIEVQLYAEEAI